MKFRSIYIAFEAFPRPKGASVHIASMVRALSQEYAPVLLLCCGYGEMPARQVEGAIEIRRHRLYDPNLLRRAESFGDFVAEQVAAASDAEIMVFRDPWGGAPALLANRGAASIFEVNALPRWELGYAYPGLKANPALQAKIEDQENFCLRSSDRLLTVCQVTARALARLGVPSDRTQVIPNCVDAAFLASAASGEPVPELQTGTWFAYFGSLHPWQGVETVIDAFAAFAPDLPEARLLLVHNGRKQPLRGLRKRLRKRGLTTRVWLHPPLPRCELAGLVAQVSFTVAPLTECTRNTRQGCCPVKIIESLAVGTPVLASDLAVVRELISDRRQGRLLPPADVRAWALALHRALSRPEGTGTADRQALRRMTERFSAQPIHARLRASFRSAVAGSACRQEEKGGKP